MKKTIFTLAVGVSAALVYAATYENRPAVVIGNSKVIFTVLPQGTTIASVILRDDINQLNPLWNPLRMARESGAPREPATAARGTGFGHFLCLDGFGSPSNDERAAGMPGHGEAHDRDFEHDGSYSDGQNIHVFSTELPLTQERVTRTMRLRDNESVLEVYTEVESLLAFDRPIFWAEHATVGSPFLESTATVVDFPGIKSKTRPYSPAKAGLPHRLASDKEFTWPLAPGVDGKPLDLRAAPVNPDSGDHTASLLDPLRKLVFVTMLNTRRHLLLGYVFRAADYPWLQNWENYPANGKLARGLEFSTLPYDMPRRLVVEEGKMFGTPLYRWLPAKGKINSKFLMFYTPVPAGFRKVSDVRLADGAVTIEDAAAHLTVKLATKAVF